MKKLKLLLLAASIIGTTACTKESTNCEEQANRLGICTADFTPVCGCNDKTYSNACNAENVGITNYTQGACK